MTRRLIGSAALVFAALATAPVANSDPGAYSSEDEAFYRILTEGTEHNPALVLTDPPLVRAQALQACQRLSDGMDDLEVVDMLMAEGPYSWDVASTIVAAAPVFYCREHLDF